MCESFHRDSAILTTTVLILYPQRFNIEIDKNTISRYYSKYELSDFEYKGNNKSFNSNINTQKSSYYWIESTKNNYTTIDDNYPIVLPKTNICRMTNYLYVSVYLGYHAHYYEGIQKSGATA